MAPRRLPHADGSASTEGAGFTERSPSRGLFFLPVGSRERNVPQISAEDPNSIIR